MQEITPIPDIVIHALPDLSKKSTMALLLIYQQKFISEAELLNKILVRPSDVAPIMGSISKYVTIYSTASREVYYAVNLTLLLADHDCSSCSCSVKKVFRNGGGAVRYYECSSEIVCVHDHARLAEATIKIHKLCRKLKVIENIGHKVIRKETEAVRDYADMDVKLWRNKDYVDYIYDKYKEYYPHLSTLTKKSINIGFQALKKTFTAEYEEEEWPLRMKHYITWAFDAAAKKNKVVSMKYICGHRNMVEFANTSTYVKQLMRCEQYDIMCPYMAKTCTIQSGGAECTSKLMGQMKKRYN
jgi:hypothetical protein